MPIVDCIQQSPEWLASRCGRVTGSRMADVMSYLKKGGESQARKDYRAELVCEILTGLTAEHYVSPAMQWGMDNELLARAAYEMERDVIVEDVGFAIHPKILRCGASPDGLIGSDGVLEIKCPNTATHIEYICAGLPPEEYRWQMFAEMACCERKWADFVSYDPRLPKDLRLFIVRLEWHDELIKQMEAEVEKFLAETDEVIAMLKTAEPTKGIPPSLEAQLQRSVAAVKK
jgi:hypothetical protein